MHHKASELVHLAEDLVAPEGVARLAETIRITRPPYYMQHKAPFLYASQGTQIICITQAQNMLSQGAPLHHKAPLLYASQGP